VCYLFPVSRLLTAALLALAVELAGCQRPTGEQCERLCWRSNELNFWQKFDLETRDKPPAEVEKLRAERRKTWDEMKAREFDPGLENCVRECRRSASVDDVACVERATTAEQAAACLD
jgi:hypothetical protein